jgi:hypothetical protein
VFATGLSTAESVTDTSGRGVGAGAVKASVERLGGEVHVESVLGQGTTFVLRMPLEGGLGRVWSPVPPIAPMRTRWSRPGPARRGGPSDRPERRRRDGSNFKCLSLCPHDE